MSLQVNVNITKGWPNPSILEKSLAGETALAQGDIVRVNSDGKWEKGIDALGQVPFIIMVDSTDPSTNRGSHEPTSYVQLGFGAIHGIALSNPLEIETTNYDSDTYTVGLELSAPAGQIQKAVTNDIVVATVIAAPFARGTKSYLTIIPVAPYKKA